ncbi:unnamed protein product [Acanthoscelides obtectus]|uniref:DDE Tnp4 domain-containing protein n=3 Tax=Acanthoscelides obtectus TaxID=200917 RepID=A0A9P0LQ39_ACAOB|nr:unnamed protein product [Acanthoscelides obtectus]CAK1679839.1 Protein ANTAGONIST OF LIKE HETEROCHROMATIN PROTEIN 1 [Acanthoscelides obtectus]
MDENRFVACAAAISAIMTVCLLLKKNKKKRRLWVRPWIARREQQGIHHTLLRELQFEDLKSYINYLRMDEDSFKFIASKISPLISKQNTHLRNCISVEERLMVTLRFLATGESYRSLQYSSRIPQCTLSGIIPETCEAIYQALKGDFLKVPRTEKEWLDIAKDFEDKWNVFNTIGAMDGKHVRITCPDKGGSHHFNYKSYHSIILFALTDANYKFIYIDVGTNGRIGDSGVYNKSKLKKCLADNSILNIPAGKNLPGANIATPYVVLADDAFPLSYNVMKPYPLKNITREEKIYNYRLSRGRRIVESSFGILASRFRVFLTTINLCPEKVTKIVLAACTIHNLLIDRRKHLYTCHEIISRSRKGHTFLDVLSHEELQELQTLTTQTRTVGNRHGREIRENFKIFYNGAGKVPWQEEYA